MSVASLDRQQTDIGQDKIDYGNIVNKPQINGVTLEGNLSSEDIGIIVPTKVSELENDTGYITSAVDDLENYYDKEEVDQKISLIPKYDIKVVDELPTEDISPTTIYLLRVEGSDHYIEYVFVDGEWDELGNGNIDLSDYTTYEYVDGKLAEKANISDLDDVAFSGSYDDLVDTPTALSDFTNDVGYLTEVPNGSVTRAKLDPALSGDISDIESAVSTLQSDVRGLSADKADKTTVSALADVVATKANISDVPTKTSDLTNDSDFVSDANYVHTDNNFTTALKNKLNGIEAGAEANVQSDWNVADNSSDAFIKNKPSIPTKTSDIVNDSGYITSAAIPTNVSAFNNDAGYLDSIPDESVGLDQLDDGIVNVLASVSDKADRSEIITSYEDLDDKPMVNSVTLVGDKSLADLDVTRMSNNDIDNAINSVV